MAVGKKGSKGKHKPAPTGSQPQPGPAVAIEPAAAPPGVSDALSLVTAAAIADPARQDTRPSDPQSWTALYQQLEALSQTGDALSLLNQAITAHGWPPQAEAEGLEHLLIVWFQREPNLVFDQLLPRLQTLIIKLCADGRVAGGAEFLASLLNAAEHSEAAFRGLVQLGTPDALTWLAILCPDRRPVVEPAAVLEAAATHEPVYELSPKILDLLVLVSPAVAQDCLQTLEQDSALAQELLKQAIARTREAQAPSVSPILNFRRQGLLPILSGWESRRPEFFREKYPELARRYLRPLDGSSRAFFERCSRQFRLFVLEHLLVESRPKTRDGHREESWGRTYPLLLDLIRVVDAPLLAEFGPVLLRHLEIDPSDRRDEEIIDLVLGEQAGAMLGRRVAAKISQLSGQKGARRGSLEWLGWFERVAGLPGMAAAVSRLEASRRLEVVTWLMADGQSRSALAVVQAFLEQDEGWSQLTSALQLVQALNCPRALIERLGTRLQGWLEHSWSSSAEVEPGILRECLVLPGLAEQLERFLLSSETFVLLAPEEQEGILRELYRLHPPDSRLQLIARYASLQPDLDQRALARLVAADRDELPSSLSQVAWDEVSEPSRRLLADALQNRLDQEHTELQADLQKVRADLLNARSKTATDTRHLLALLRSAWVGQDSLHAYLQQMEAALTQMETRPLHLHALEELENSLQRSVQIQTGGAAHQQRNVLSDCWERWTEAPRPAEEVGPHTLQEQAPEVALELAFGMLQETLDPNCSEVDRESCLEMLQQLMGRPKFSEMLLEQAGAVFELLPAQDQVRLRQPSAPPPASGTPNSGAVAQAALEALSRTRRWRENLAREESQAHRELLAGAGRALGAAFDNLEGVFRPYFSFRQELGRRLGLEPVTLTLDMLIDGTEVGSQFRLPERPKKPDEELRSLSLGVRLRGEASAVWPVQVGIVSPGDIDG